ncbi:MAG: hypothetical protein NTW29_03820 [Bacteroidetes bacterium]|nr:hypothetical protein [Bacteroidota bacterium]
MDQFLTRTVEGRDMPVFLKREITEQFPALKKGNLKHSEYAKKSVQELFSKELIRQSKQKLFNYCPSVVAYNDGKGHFRVEALPQEVQLSSLNAVCLTDINKDGKTDMLLGGNLYNFPPQFGRLDGSYGQVLLNNGKGGWKVEGPAETGVLMRGEVKDIREIGKKYIVITMNNERPLLFGIMR